MLSEIICIVTDNKQAYQNRIRVYLWPWADAALTWAGPCRSRDHADESAGFFLGVLFQSLSE